MEDSQAGEEGVEDLVDVSAVVYNDMMENCLRFIKNVL